MAFKRVPILLEHSFHTKLNYINVLSGLTTPQVKDNYVNLIICDSIFDTTLIDISKIKQKKLIIQINEQFI